MPAAYTHDRLGREVRALVTGEVRRTIDTHPHLFTIGLQGPDILFYHKPLLKNPVKNIGHAIHGEPGITFFRHASEVVKSHRHNPTNYGTHLSYLYGFLCHFILDTLCHGMINQIAEETGVCHSAVESLLDRAFMLRDGVNPARYKPTAHLVPSPENAAVIKDFYPGTTINQIKKGVAGMVFYCNILVMSTETKRKLFSVLLSRNKDLMGHIIPAESNPLCETAIEEIMGLYEKAKSRIPSLLAQLPDFTDEIFQYNFNASAADAAEKQMGETSL